MYRTEKRTNSIHVRIALAFGLLATTITGLLIAPTQDANAATRRIDSAEVAAVKHINAYRRAHGLRPVVIDRRLTAAAEWMSRDMATKNYFSHTDSRGRSPFARMAAAGYPTNSFRGENLAAGNVAAGLTFQQWRHSPTHDRVMRTGQYRAIGIARVYSPTSSYKWYWTTTYGSRITSRF